MEANLPKTVSWTCKCMERGQLDSMMKETDILCMQESESWLFSYLCNCCKIALQRMWWFLSPHLKFPAFQSFFHHVFPIQTFAGLKRSDYCHIDLKFSWRLVCQKIQFEAENAHHTFLGTQYVLEILDTPMENSHISFWRLGFCKWDILTQKKLPFVF